MNLFFFRFYIVCISIFLFIFAFFISKQLFIFIFNRIKLNLLCIRLKKDTIDSINYLDFVSCYSLNKQFFLLICCSEFFLELKNDVMEEELVYNSLAYVYKEKCFYNISEYYLFRVISLPSFDENVLLNLSQMYNTLGFIEKSNFIINNISSKD